MIEEGAQAPLFELPGVIEGRPGYVSLDSFLGESVVVLAFYRRSRPSASGSYGNRRFP